MPTRRGLVSYRAVQAIYQAARLKELSAVYGPNIVEIGGGMGRTAYYAVRNDLPGYTIIDLPLTAVAQAVFLTITLGDAAVAFSHEADRPDATVFLRSPWQLDGAFDIAFNADGLTEMDRSVAEDYLRFIAANCRAFLSINHEINEYRVTDLARSAGLRSIYRQPYWMRNGYVEELYVPS